MTDGEVEQVISASRVTQMLISWRLDASPEAIERFSSVLKKLFKKKPAGLAKGAHFRGTVLRKAPSSYLLTYEMIYSKSGESSTEPGSLGFVIAHRLKPKGSAPKELREAAQKGINSEWLLGQLSGIREPEKRFLFRTHTHISIPRVRPRYFEALDPVELGGGRFRASGVEFRDAPADTSPTSEGLIGFQISDDEDDAELSDIYLTYRRWADDLDSPEREVAGALRWARVVLKDC